MAISWSVLLLSGIGGAVVSAWVVQTISFLTFHFVPSDGRLKRYQREPRAWGLVTGASQGIGLGHIQELAARGFGVIILAHKEDEVDRAVAEVKQEFPQTPVEKVILDASTATYKDISKALTPFKDLPITVLVNNVSIQPSIPLFTEFSTYTPEDISSSIAANNTFALFLTRFLYPTLNRNGPSLVMNVSSAAHAIGLPWLTVYSGTKAFTESWAKALSREAKGAGDKIDSITIIPGDVRTPGNVHGVSPTSPTGRDFARMALDRVEKAVARGLFVFTPYWKHDVTIGLTKTLPDSVVTPAAIADIAHRKDLEAKAS